MSDTYAEDVRLDREAEEEFKEWCKSLGLHGVRADFILIDELADFEPDKEEKDD